MVKKHRSGILYISTHRQTLVHLQVIADKKTRFRSPLNSTAALNLNCSLVFFFNSFFLYFFEKVPKTGQSCTAFGASFVQELLCNIFQSVHTSPLAACRNAWGGKNSLRSNIMPPVSKHCSAALYASQRCPLDKLLMLAAKTQTSLAFARLHVTFRPWRGITFAIEIYWYVLRTLTRTMLIF